MRITDISGHALSSPIEPLQERSFSGGTRKLLKRDMVLGTVETADGRRGVAPGGSSSSAMREYFEDDSQGTFADILEGPIADALVGESIDNIEAAHDLIQATGLSSRLKEEAASIVDIALYDLRGKELGAPIHELLAEEYSTEATTELPVYASAGMYMEPEGYAEQAKLLADNGFYGYKYRPGIGPDGDRRTLELLADTLDETEIMQDVHTWWKLRDTYDRDVVRDLVEHAADHGVYWVEEPTEPTDYEGYVELSDIDVPIAGGESEETAHGLVELAETDAISFLQGDVRHHGGFTGCREPIEFCHGRDVEFVPHNFGTWLGLLANAHLVAAAPETRLLEYPVFEDDPLLDTSNGEPGMYPNELAFDIIEGQPQLENGTLTVPDGHGLGVTINDDVVEAYPFVDGAWTEFQYTQ
jgi:L-rhamnonate dehydratase